jgi:hypothetical protein
MLISTAVTGLTGSEVLRAGGRRGWAFLAHLVRRLELLLLLGAISLA